MKMWKIILPAAAFLLLAGQAAAQTDEENERLRYAEDREVAMEERLKRAEARMAEAAREIAEISKERLPRIAEIERRFAWSSKPRLGVNIESVEDAGPVEGVKIIAVTPGSAASDAGLRTGDIMTAVNNEPLSASSASEANERLLDFMKGIEGGDVIEVEYLRDGKVGSVEVEPRIVTADSFVWAGGDKPLHIEVPSVPIAPEVIERFKMQFTSPWAHTGLGELELVSLNEGLGRYFGTDKGLLVVKAPNSDAFDLQDGDVIQNIDGREPADVRHALRILGSYAPGEKLKLGIMRDKRKRTIDVEIPADRHGSLAPEASWEVLPALAPGEVSAPLAVPLPDGEEAVIVIDITS
ncbi:MAG TPA: PDZ domain-containing protein [Woeseiaceae bacterium]|jgi:C-terminal processing protease CtpA/Prc|nr:PDZ domain-containing protein [Woeseiaceae bacterium]